jgi:hypothetical protein
MKPNWWHRFSVFGAFILAASLAAPAWAQDQTPEGKDWGNYHVNQSIELGWRGTSFSGNNDVYDTFVNLGQGVRLYNQSLEMRSLNHDGLLFDNLYFSNFGYGGDPNDFSILRVSKNKWYDFNSTFRRDRNLWNYDLLANPLNPTGSNPTVIINFSPHSMALTRRMSDFNLTLLPQSKLRFRLGYFRNINEGPSLTTFHQGTEALLFQEFKATTNAYQFGVDFKPVARTNFSYDQFVNYYKGDTTQTDQHLLYQDANGQLVDLGVSFDTKNNNPCRAPITDPSTTPPTVNPTCNSYTGFDRSGPVRTSYPTEQFSFQSNYFHNVDMAGRVVYSSSDARVPDYNQLFQGFESRTLATQISTSGSAAITRINASADYDVTFSITPKFRIVDEFRFSYFRIPGQNNLSTADLFSASLLVAPIVFNPSTCSAPFNPSTCPTHGNSSGADQATTVSSLFLGQDAKINTIQFEYDFTKRFGGRIGYRFRHRIIDQRNVELSTSTYDPILPANSPCNSVTLNADGSCTINSSSSDSSSVDINESSLLVGLWARPVNGLRLSYDQELLYADNSFTRISPRQSQHYKGRIEYRANNWLSMGSTINVYEARNNVAQINHLEHTRSYGYFLTVAPRERWSFDFGYDYTGVFSQTNICYIFGSGPPPAGVPACPIAGSAATLQGISIYNNKLNYGYADIMVKPVQKVTMRLGYALDSVSGNTLILNPNASPGPLNFNYNRPYGSVDVAVAKGVTARAGWGFYDYDEKFVNADLTGPRSFRGNLVNLSLIYSF